MLQRGIRPKSSGDTPAAPLHASVARMACMKTLVPNKVQKAARQ